MMVYYLVHINLEYKNGSLGRRIQSQDLIKNSGARAFKVLGTSEQECKAHAHQKIFFCLNKRTNYKMYSSNNLSRIYNELTCML